MRSKGRRKVIKPSKTVGEREEQASVQNGGQPGGRWKFAPRMLRRVEAAAYCGLSEPRFVQACPILPIAFMGRIPRYDRYALDEWLDSLAEDSERLDLADEWSRGRQQNAS